MASYATPPPQREAPLLSVGAQCSHPSCQLIDFLPFKCQHCALSFCQEHFRVEAHSCDKFDESKHNRVAPNCPLCNTPVAIPPGQDPNARMEAHFATECSVMTGKAKTKSTPVCARGSCKKVLFSPIKCDKCKLQFCPSHRFPSDHSCASLSSSKPTPAPTPAAPRVATKNISVASAAFKKSITSMAASANPSNAVRQPAVSPPKSLQTKPIATPVLANKPNPFSKTDRPSILPALPSLAFPSLDVITSRTDAVHDDNNNIPSTTNTNLTINNHIPDISLKSKPSPAIDPMSFIPPPIFGYA